MWQQVEIIGNVGEQPEMRYLPSGVPVASFSVAVNKSWKDKDSGEMKQTTTWFRVSAWNRLAEICTEFLRKGSRVFVQGEVAAGAYVPRDGGKPVGTLELKADTVRFLDSRRDEDDGHDSQPYKPAATPSDKEDIPF